ncbi:hypothetical protein [Paraburkholderia xenovorans]
MTITELIAQLERMRAEHGDLQVMTPGFDESGFDLAGDLSVESVVPLASPSSHCGEYEAVDRIDGKWRIAGGSAFNVVVIQQL